MGSYCLQIPSPAGPWLALATSGTFMLRCWDASACLEIVVGSVETGNVALLCFWGHFRFCSRHQNLLLLFISLQMLLHRIICQHRLFCLGFKIQSASELDPGPYSFISSFNIWDKVTSGVGGKSISKGQVLGWGDVVWDIFFLVDIHLGWWNPDKVALWYYNEAEPFV